MLDSNFTHGAGLGAVRYFNRATSVYLAGKQRVEANKSHSGPNEEDAGRIEVVDGVASSHLRHPAGVS